MPSDEAVATHAILPFRNSCTSFGIFAIWFFFLFVALLSGSGFQQLFQKMSSVAVANVACYGIRYW
jgi:hypothetical protein